MAEVKSDAAKTSEKTEKKAVSKKYLVNTKCYFQQHLYRPGEVVEFSGITPPDYFTEVK